MVLSAAGLGLRPGELFGLTVDCVEFLKRTLRVEQEPLPLRGQGVKLGPLKTAASYRSVPLPDVVGQDTAAHLKIWPPHPGLGVVFTNEPRWSDPAISVRRDV